MSESILTIEMANQFKKINSIIQQINNKTEVNECYELTGKLSSEVNNLENLLKEVSATTVDDVLIKLKSIIDRR